MKNKLLKTLLPIATAMTTITPVVLLTSCSKNIEVDDWQDNALISDVISIKPNSRFIFEIEYDEWFEHSGGNKPMGQFCIQSSLSTSTFTFDVHKIEFNREPLTPDTHFSLSEDKTTIMLDVSLAAKIMANTKIIIDTTVKTDKESRAFFKAW